MDKDRGSSIKFLTLLEKKILDPGLIQGRRIMYI